MCKVSTDLVRARAVGNAVYLDHDKGSAGYFAAWGEVSEERAEFVAAQINKAIALSVSAVKLQPSIIKLKEAMISDLSRSG